MTWRRMGVAVALTFLSSVAGINDAQAQGASDSSGYWGMAGVAYTGLRAECGEPGHDVIPGCEPSEGERHRSWMGGAGIALQRRADLGVKVAWTPATLSTGDQLNTLEIFGIARYRPLARRGFFVSGAVGLGWLIDSLEGIEPRTSERAKGLAVEVGAGWEWRLHQHLGLQAFGTQHMLTLGDLPTVIPEFTLPNVTVNYWSAGVAIVVR